MSVEVLLQKATVSQAMAISNLISELSKTHIAPALSPQGRDHLLSAVTEPKIASYLNDESFEYHVASVAGQLAGVVAVRNNSHLYHLFVADPYQGQGISRMLWEFAKARCLTQGNPGRFTVNSSHNARHVYLRFGFVPIPDSVPKTHEELELRVTPMVLDQTRERFAV